MIGGLDTKMSIFNFYTTAMFLYSKYSVFHVFSKCSGGRHVRVLGEAAHHGQNPDRVLPMVGGVLSMVGGAGRPYSDMPPTTTVGKTWKTEYFEYKNMAVV